jgi:hypothetical protein
VSCILGTKSPNNSTTATTLEPACNTFLLAVLTAYRQAGRVDEALNFSHVMEELADQTGYVFLYPNTACYLALIWAHAKVGDADSDPPTLLHMQEVCDRGEQLDMDMQSNDWITVGMGRKSPSSRTDFSFYSTNAAKEKIMAWMSRY